MQSRRRLGQEALSEQWSSHDAAGGAVHRWARWVLGVAIILAGGVAEAAPDADKTSGLDDLSLDCELNPEITVEAEKDESGTQEELVRQAQPIVDQPTKLLKLHI